jgi:hypothetical protein
MNWAECTKATESIFEHSRFSPPIEGVAGFDCQPGVTLSDLTGGIAWAWTYPGDAVLRFPEINRFMELEANQTGGYLSAAITLFFVVMTIEFLKFLFGLFFP